jgi:hypothetical protein
MHMLSLMQPGKRYRLRVAGSHDFVEGYFLDGGFYSDQAQLVGHLEDDGSFLYCSGDRTGNVLKYFHALTGRVKGLRLVRLDGTGFDLVEFST